MTSLRVLPIQPILAEWINRPVGTLQSSVSLSRDYGGYNAPAVESVIRTWNDKAWNQLSTQERLSLSLFGWNYKLWDSTPPEMKDRLDRSFISENGEKVEDKKLHGLAEKVNAFASGLNPEPGNVVLAGPKLGSGDGYGDSYEDADYGTQYGHGDSRDEDLDLPWRKERLFAVWMLCKWQNMPSSHKLAAQSLGYSPVTWNERIYTPQSVIANGYYNDYPSSFKGANGNVARVPLHPQPKYRDPAIDAPPIPVPEQFEPDKTYYTAPYPKWPRPEDYPEMKTTYPGALRPGTTVLPPITTLGNALPAAPMYSANMLPMPPRPAYPTYASMMMPAPGSVV